MVSAEIAAAFAGPVEVRFPDTGAHRFTGTADATAKHAPIEARPDFWANISMDPADPDMVPALNEFRASGADVHSVILVWAKGEQAGKKVYPWLGEQCVRMCRFGPLADYVSNEAIKKRTPGQHESDWYQFRAEYLEKAKFRLETTPTDHLGALEDDVVAQFQWISALQALCANFSVACAKTRGYYNSHAHLDRFLEDNDFMGEDCEDAFDIARVPADAQRRVLDKMTEWGNFYPAVAKFKVHKDAAGGGGGAGGVKKKKKKKRTGDLPRDAFYPSDYTGYRLLSTKRAVFKEKDFSKHLTRAQVLAAPPIQGINPNWLEHDADLVDKLCVYKSMAPRVYEGSTVAPVKDLTAFRLGRNDYAMASHSFEFDLGAKSWGLKMQLGSVLRTNKAPVVPYTGGGPPAAPVAIKKRDFSALQQASDTATEAAAADSASTGGGGGGGNAPYGGIAFADAGAAKKARADAPNGDVFDNFDDGAQ
jgi:hypothetical protein